MDLERYADQVRVYGALADPHRLAIVDELRLSDRSPTEVGDSVRIDSNLLAHHLGILEAAGLIERVASQGDRRRRYIRLTSTAKQVTQPVAPMVAGRIVFVCTENAARSQLAQGIWNQTQLVRAISAGTRPAKRLHPGTIRAASRRGIDLRNARPAPLPELGPDDLVITVCDRAHEELSPQIGFGHLHWSIPDPATDIDPRAYESSAEVLSHRIADAADHILAAPAAEVQPARR
jgi:protein-tyrosine-phosphatase